MERKIKEPNTMCLPSKATPRQEWDSLEHQIEGQSYFKCVLSKLVENICGELSKFTPVNHFIKEEDKQ